MQVSEKLVSLTQITWPIVLTSILLYIKAFIPMLFLGHLGKAALAGGWLAVTLANVTGFSVMKGLATGMEPICHQAYGAKSWGVMISAFRKTILLLLFAACIISVLWLNMKPVFLLMSRNRDVARLAETYIMYSIPDLFALALFNPLRTFLRTQDINWPITISMAIAMIAHYPITYFLVDYLHLGVKGVALAAPWNTVNINLGLLVYLSMSKTSLQPWSCGSTDGSFFKGWSSLLVLSGASLLSVCLEWWCYEILTLFCTLLSHPEANVAAMGILIQATSFLYVFPSSLSSGLIIQVGHELGAGEPEQARQTTILGMKIALVWGIIAVVLTTTLKGTWGKLFTTEAMIISLTSAALPIVGFCELGNSHQTAACGVLVGSARPKMACCINFVSFYLIGLPVAGLLTFGFKIGFVGVWYGMLAAQISCLCMMVRALVYTDWVQQAERSKKLTQVELEEPRHQDGEKQAVQQISAGS